MNTPAGPQESTIAFRKRQHLKRKSLLPELELAQSLEQDSKTPKLQVKPTSSIMSSLAKLIDLLEDTIKAERERTNELVSKLTRAESKIKAQEERIGTLSGLIACLTSGKALTQPAEPNYPAYELAASFSDDDSGCAFDWINSPTKIQEIAEFLKSSVLDF